MDKKTPSKPTVPHKPLKHPVPWQRLVLSLVGIGIVAAMWERATFHFYAMPAEAMTGFTSVTNNAFYVIAAIVVFMVSGKMIYDWKNQTTSSVVQQANQIIENHHSVEERKEEIHQTIDVVVKEAGINAPELKPFGEHAIGDETLGEYNDFER